MHAGLRTFEFTEEGWMQYYDKELLLQEAAYTTSYTVAHTTNSRAPECLLPDSGAPALALDLCRRKGPPARQSSLTGQIDCFLKKGASSLSRKT